MECLIQLYLSRNYEIKTSEVGNDGIYLISDIRKHRAPIYRNALLDDLWVVFMLDKPKLQRYINKWANQLDPSVDLVFYWSDKPSIFSQVDRY